MRLRETRADELGRVLAMEADPDAAPFIERWSATEHRHAMADPDQAHLALEQAGEMVGFVLLAGLTRPHRSIELRRIVVSPAGRGLGSTGLSLVIDEAFERLGAHRLWLDVKTDNARAQRAYERAGFVAEGVLRDALLTDGRFDSLIVLSMLEGERHRASGGRPRD